MNILTDSLREDLAVMTTESHVESIGRINDEPVIELYCRDSDGNRRTVLVEDFFPYFYTTRSAYEEHKDALLNESVIREVVVPPTSHGLREQTNATVSLDSDSELPTSLADEQLVKIVTQLPKHIPTVRDFLHKKDKQTFEADVFFTDRFLIDKEIYDGVSVPVVTDEDDERYVDDETIRISADDIEAGDAPDVDPRMLSVDIEVLQDGEFPEPVAASHPVTAITLHDSYTDDIKAYILRSDNWNETTPQWDFGRIETFDTAISLDADVTVFDDEAEMLAEFFTYVDDHDVDILTGWNSSSNDRGNGFDYPYLINRAENVNESTVENLAQKQGNVYVTRQGRANTDGRMLLDMMQSYMKTQIHDKESYALDDIAQDELGTGKDDVEDLDTAWRESPNLFLKYNVRDTLLVYLIEQQKRVIDIYQHIRSIAGVSFEEIADANIGIIDSVFLRAAKESGYALPTSVKPDVQHYHGAYVFSPVPGLHPNVIYPDLASLYPYLLIDMNASPETIVGDEQDLEDSEYTEEDCHVLYIDRRDEETKKEQDDVQREPLYVLKPDVKTSFIRSVIGDLVDMKYEYKKPEYAPEAYSAIKRVTNSCFTPDTDVLTPDGVCKITDLEVGDEVYSMHPETQEMEVKCVTETIEKPEYDDEIIHIQNDNVDIKLTPDHRMLVTDSKDSDELETVDAGELRTDKTYYTPRGKEFTVQSDATTETAENGVYCVQVEDNHTLVAGRNGKFINIWNCYGVLGDSNSYGKGFRLFDWRIAEAITLAGRDVIQHTAEEIRNFTQDKGYEETQIIGGDTDAAVISIPEADGTYETGEITEDEATSYIRSHDDLSLDAAPATTPMHESLVVAMQAAEVIDDSYEDFMQNRFNIDNTHMAVEIESYASRAFFIEKKKRYAELIEWDEGDYETEQSITGFEYVRSDSAQATKDVQKDLFNALLREDDPESVAKDIVNDYYEDVKNGNLPLEDIGRPKSLNKAPEEYGDANRTAMPRVRGAKWTNKNIDGEHIDSGSKPLLFYVKDIDFGDHDYNYKYHTHTAEDQERVDAIAVNDPSNIPDVVNIDYEKMADKIIKDKLKRIIRAMDWDWDEIRADSQQTGLGNFM